MNLESGIIVSIQGYHYKTIEELARDAIRAGCVGLRIDKRIELSEAERVPIIGLKKAHVTDVEHEAYITTSVDDVEEIAAWADYVAIDYRALNPNLTRLSRYCREHSVKVVADIRTYEDYRNLVDNNYCFECVATTLSVFGMMYKPDLDLVRKVASDGQKMLIAEGNFSSRKDVQKALELGAHAVCVGSAISNVYKLTKKYTSVKVSA